MKSNNNKLGIFSLLICWVTLILTAPAVKAPTCKNNKQIEFAWDIHDVLVRKNTAGMINILLAQNAHKTFPLIGRLGYNYVRYCCTGTVGKSQQMVYDVRQLLKKGAVGEEYKKVIEKYDPALWAIAEKMAAEQYPIKGMPRLIQELNSLGYTQRIASNIGSHEIKNLQNRHAQLFGYFQEGKTVDYLGQGKQAVQKPSLEYFKQYMATYNPDGTKTIIFIDDRLDNVQAARTSGMVGIHFKNAKQLRQELKKLNIAIA